MKETNDKKIKLFYFITENDITFYSLTENKKLTIYKSKKAYEELKKLIDSNKYEFIQLI